MIAWRKRIHPTVLLLLLLALISGIAPADEQNPPWPVPAGAAKMPNPAKPSAARLAVSAKTYLDNCRICHGRTGGGNGPSAENLTRRPASFRDASMMARTTDGALFWKMTNGRLPMPGWKDKLSDLERWEMVNYLRTLASKPATSDDDNAAGEN